jgi:hypothetical protein
MIWLSWRQFRAQAAVVFGVLAVVAIALAVTGPHLVSIADGYLKVCRADKDCGMTNNPVLTTDARLEGALNVLVILLPALIGIFWGAPLIARELETGTYRLSWTQSVTRTRWLAVKVGVVGLVSVVGAGLFLRAARPGPHRVHGLRLRRGRHRRDTHTPDAARYGRHARRLRGSPGSRDLRAPTAPPTPRTRRLGHLVCKPDRVQLEPVWPPGGRQLAEHAQRVGPVD